MKTLKEQFTFDEASAIGLIIARSIDNLNGRRVTGYRFKEDTIILTITTSSHMIDTPGKYFTVKMKISEFEKRVMDHFEDILSKLKKK